MATYNCKKVHKSCMYAFRISGKYICCDYINVEHQRRGCPSEACDKYKNKGKKRKKRVKHDD